MKRLSLLLTFMVLFPSCLLFAGEGMWIPMLLQYNEKEMQAMGMKITADDIYSINHGSLKDAIVLFGGGCTGEIVSNQGLLLTNHHCGYGYIQRHSSVEHDYLTDGFWAMNQGEELPCPGLTVTILREMRDVTEKVLTGITDDMAETDRNAKIDDNIKKIVESIEKQTEYKVSIKPFSWAMNIICCSTKFSVMCVSWAARHPTSENLAATPTTGFGHAIPVISASSAFMPTRTGSLPTTAATMSLTSPSSISTFH